MAAIPFIPQNFAVQTGNMQNLLTWSVSPGATSYLVNRSLDGVTWTAYASSSINQYVDSAVSVGVQYFYQVASSNVTGTSSYCEPISVVPTYNGEMSLGQIRVAAKQRADREESQFVSDVEWNSYINQSMYELYDLLINTYEDLYMAPALSFNTDGTTYLYPLPNGVNYNAAPAFYKLLGADLGLNTANNAYVSLHKFNFIDRNKFVYPNTSSTIYGVFNLQYRLMGDKIEFIPTPSANQPIRLWYIPRLNQLLKDTDMTAVGISGWSEYLITDAAIKALQKEESDISVLMAQKMALIKRIEETAINRDIGQPSTISDTAQSNLYGFNGPFSGFKGGW